MRVTPKRTLRDILVDAANAIADAIEGKASPSQGEPPPSEAPRNELDERNERIRLAYNERARGDLRVLQARTKKRKLTEEEMATISVLAAGYRLMPAAREKLGLTTPLQIPGEKAPARPRRRQRR
jgi:hypothetical protein